MRPLTTTVASQTTSAPLVVNWRESDFQLGIHVQAGVGTYSVQTTNDDPENFTSAANYNSAANWTTHTDFSGLTATDNGGISFPVRAVRLNVTAYTSGTYTMTVLQAT
jgi:hypothetical protein